MKKQRALMMKGRLRLLLASYALGLLAVLLTTLLALRAVLLNGPLYERIVASRALAADVLPPPLHLVR